MTGSSSYDHRLKFSKYIILSFLRKITDKIQREDWLYAYLTLLAYLKHHHLTSECYQYRSFTSPSHYTDTWLHIVWYILEQKIIFFDVISIDPVPSKSGLLPPTNDFHLFNQIIIRLSTFLFSPKNNFTLFAHGFTFDILGITVSKWFEHNIKMTPLETDTSKSQTKLL